MKLRFKSLSSFDWLLALSVFVLLVLGLSAQYGIAVGGGGGFASFTKQLVALGFGICIALALVLWNYRLLQSYAGTLWAGGAVLLFSVLLFGTNRRGTTGWFDLGIVDFQPVELAKILLVVVVAAILMRRRSRRVGWREFGATSIPVFIYVGLVLMQPDFGSAALMLGTWIIMLLFAGLDRKIIASLFGSGVVAGLVGWFAFFEEFQKNRILTFLQPDRDPLGIGYNVTQAKIAIGSGGMSGRGLGFGSQSQLQFLPEAQTDFIFAAIAEELGFIGVSLVVLGFGLIFWRIGKLLVHARDDFTGYILVGCGAIIFIQMTVNIGMNLGMFPVTGLPLPFVSHGGSSLLSGLMIFGILESIAVRSKG